MGFTSGSMCQELLLADPMLQEFVKHARLDARPGEEIPVTDDMFTAIRESFKEYPIACSKPHVKAVKAFHVPAAAKDWEIVAVSGHGLCYCTITGNCRFWIFRIKKGKLHKAFQSDSVSAFGFLPSRAGIPLLVLWTRESAVEQFAIVYKYNYGEFIEAASWKEVYQYADEDEEFRVHTTPKIYSEMPLGVFLPD